MTAFYNRSVLPSLLQAHGSKHVVDIGAGSGASTVLLGEAGIQITAVDRYATVHPDEWPCCDNRQEPDFWKAMEDRFRSTYPGVTVHKGCAVQAAQTLCLAPLPSDGGWLCACPPPPDAIWLDADLTYRGTLTILGAWADALPDGALLTGANHGRRFWGRYDGDNSWHNVVDGIASARKARPFLTELFTTWKEDWPTWMMFKRHQKPSMEIVSAATDSVPWWPEVQLHHRRYARTHGYSYSGVIRPWLSDRAQVWIKIAVMRERLRQSDAEWLFWLDADAIFWDFNRPLQLFVPPSPWEAVFPQFWDGHRDCLSTGAFFIRNCDRVRELFDEVWARGAGGHYGSEEVVLTDLASSSASPILLVAHDTFNSLPTAGIWRGGGVDFIMHAAFLHRHRTGFIRDLIARAESRTEFRAL